MADNDLFERYVMQRGYIEPGVSGREEIFKNDELLAELGTMWRSHKGAIEALIKSRIYPIERELVAEATPYEVPFLRQSMIEVAFIGDDLEAIAAEMERRKREKAGNGQENITAQPAGIPPAPYSEDNVRPASEDNGREPSAV